MKQANKTGSVYQYLDSIGVLENGTDTDIEEARKKYWSDYKKQWKREKKEKSKSFTVIFAMQEVKTINNEANKYHTNPTNYIRQSALANRNGIVDHVAIGELRELLMLHSNSLQTLLENDKSLSPEYHTLLEQIITLEESILDFLLSLKQQK